MTDRGDYPSDRKHQCDEHHPDTKERCTHMHPHRNTNHQTPSGLAWGVPECILTPDDPVNHPPHYTRHPSGIECIQITEHMGFNLGNAVKYIWRADEKGAAIEDLRKALWYIEREIARRTK